MVGESGCGKSTMLFAIAQLLSPPAAITAGSVCSTAQNLVTMTEKQLNVLRWRDYSVVMQSAMNALNPVAASARSSRTRCARTARRREQRSPSARPRCCKLVGIDPIHAEVERAGLEPLHGLALVGAVRGVRGAPFGA